MPPPPGLTGPEESGCTTFGVAWSPIPRSPPPPAVPTAGRGVGGALVGPSSWFMKSPPQQFTDEEARERTLRFVAGEDC